MDGKLRKKRNAFDRDDLSHLLIAISFANQFSSTRVISRYHGRKSPGRPSPTVRRIRHADEWWRGGESAGAAVSNPIRTLASNLPDSGGFEGLALNKSGTRLYALLEKAINGDPVRTRLIISEFSIG
jgi:hypothetical protein